MSKKLEKYKEKRNFDKTPEPTPQINDNLKEENIFVVQKHDATRLHYDFRLEIQGTLKSWAIPKGPSTDPEEKRLAIETEDHPLEYANFEGIIPKDNYGAGPVIIWDYGTYKNINYKDSNKLHNKLISMEESYTSGHIVVDLDGHKLKGGYALIHAKLGGEEKNWLFVKVNDEYAHKPEDLVKDYPKSIKSGLTIEELSNDSEHKS